MLCLFTLSFCMSLSLMGQLCFNMLALQYALFGQRWLKGKLEQTAMILITVKVALKYSHGLALGISMWLKVEAGGSASKRYLHSTYAVFSWPLCLFEVVGEGLWGPRSELKTPPPKLPLWYFMEHGCVAKAINRLCVRFCYTCVINLCEAFPLMLHPSIWKVTQWFI